MSKNYKQLLANCNPEVTGPRKSTPKPRQEKLEEEDSNLPKQENLKEEAGN